MPNHERGVSSEYNGHVTNNMIYENIVRLTQDLVKGLRGSKNPGLTLLMGSKFLMSLPGDELVMNLTVSCCSFRSGPSEVYYHLMVSSTGSRLLQFFLEHSPDIRRIVAAPFPSEFTML